MSTRWLHLKRVFFRVIEQRDNLYQYFINFLPRLENCKIEIKEASRYKQFVENRKSGQTLPYLSFVSFVAQELEYFLISFQSSELLIHIINEDMRTLLLNLLTKCIKKNYLFEKRMPFYHETLIIDLGKLQQQKLIRLVDIGKVKSFLSNNIVISEIEDSFQKQCVKFSIIISQYLISELTFDVKIIRDEQYLYPLKRNDTGATAGISCLALKMIQVLSKNYREIDNFSSVITPEKLCDIIRNQWSNYQPTLKKILDEFVFSLHEASLNKRYQKGYWERTFKNCGIQQQTSKDKKKYHAVDHYCYIF